MSRYLLQLSLGPVQDFIQQARRSRDMWFGSHLLSELSRAAARGLARRSHFKLVFPALDAADSELDECLEMRRVDGAFPMAVSNIVLAASPIGMPEDAVVAASAHARAEVVEAWKRFVANVDPGARDLVDPNQRYRLTSVIEELLEFYASWREIADDPDRNELDEARRAVASAIASRKVLRDFSPWIGSALPKSSLDGFRESILFDRTPRSGPGPTAAQREAARRYRVPDSEHLDALGFIKRCGGKPEQFVPLARIAVEPWLQARRAAMPRDFTAMRSELARIIHQYTMLATCGGSSVDWLQGFPYDGELFFEDQWTNQRPSEAATTYDRFTGRFVRPLLRDGAPDPYLACLHADGDRMGEALSTRRRLEDLVTASKQIAAFAASVRKIIEDHQGSLVYAGGDDVLAFVPTTRAVTCAHALAEHFGRCMGLAFRDLASNDRPTLSVGIGITHVLDPLGEHLDRARRAEKVAKTGSRGELAGAESRNALAIISSRRGGAEAVARWRWTENPERAVADTVELFAHDAFPHGLPYEVRELLGRFPQPGDLAGPEASERWRGILVGELAHMARHKALDGLGGTSTDAEVWETWGKLGFQLPAEAGYDRLRATTEDWLERALAMRHIALAERAVTGTHSRVRSREAREGAQP